MAFVSRGFRGRRAADADPARVPPGQYGPRDFPVLSAGPTPHTALELWDFSIVGELDEPRGWSWEEFRALPSEEITRDIHCVTKWSKLDTVWQGVSVDTLLAGIETSAEYVTQYSDGGYTTNLPSRTSPAARRGSSSPTEVNRSRPSTVAPRACSSRTSTSGRAPSGYAASGSSRPTSPASGRQTATTTTETHGRNSATRATDLAARRTGRGRRRDAGRQDARLRRPRLARPPGRPARRCSVDRGGRLSGGAKLLDRLGARQHPRRAHDPETRGRRGLPLPDRRTPPGRQDRAARPDRRLLRLGAFRGRATHARRRRIGDRATDGDDPDTRSRRHRHRNALALLRTQRGRSHLSRRARSPERQRPHGCVHADRFATARVDALRATWRPRDAGRGRAQTSRAAALLHVRADAVRRGRGRGARAARTRAAGDQDRTLRTHRRLKWTS